MTSRPRHSSAITYRPRPDATSEGELTALAQIYRYVLDSHASRECGPDNRPADAKGSEDDRARSIIQRH
jgi:hypothetical protein